KKQYMDFVPVRRESVKVLKSEEKKVSKAKRSVGATKPVKTARAVKAAGVVKTVGDAPKKTGAVTFASEKKTGLGAIENLNARFVKSDVPKRPLSQKSHFTESKTGIMAAKAQKIGNRKPTIKADKPVEKSKKNLEDKKVYKMPSTPFINQNKVQKRPLSKNVYAKKVVAPKEEPKGPVTIISKPEKQAHVGLIVTIILTIILGAAAGTIAFLLLPK
ncbi:MAG: hypothetical protein Q4F56_02740, partial [Candidatus Saccharibacteria bacterium]|nr:hypothetical protein [Candidatus Saccharibacteria bacterium]